MARIFDIHHHIGPRDRLTGADEEYDFEAAAEKHLRVMDEYGIEQICLIASHNARITGTDDVRWLNRKIAEVCAARPDRFAAGAGTVDPGLGDAGLKEIEYCATQLGLNAMAWHPRFAGMPTDAPPVRRYVGATAEFGLPILMHMMAESNFEAPWRLARVAREYPAAQIVALDAFTTMNQAEWIVNVGGELPNVTFELALLRSCSIFLDQFVVSYGAERLIFGSDYYDDVRTRYPAGIGELSATDMSEADRAKILNGNARRVLGLSG